MAGAVSDALVGLHGRRDRGCASEVWLVRVRETVGPAHSEPSSIVSSAEASARGEEERRAIEAAW